MGGGLPVTWYWVDFKRCGPKSGPPLVERVVDIFKTRDRTAFIALVAHANIKRYILASENMKVGDLIKTSGELTKNPGNSLKISCFKSTNDYMIRLPK
jgi:large subunit ribosomal protein L2